MPGIESKEYNILDDLVLHQQEGVNDFSSSQIQDAILGWHQTLESQCFVNLKNEVDLYAARGEVKPTVQELYDRISSEIEGKRGIPKFLKENEAAYKRYIESFGYPTESKKEEGEGEKVQIRSHIEREMSLESIVNDPKIDVDDFSSFAEGVKNYLKSRGLLEGDWLKYWDAQFISGRVAQISSDSAEGVMFEGFEEVLRAKQKEAQSIRSQEDRIETVLDNVDQFLTDDYLGRHKNLEKKLQSSSLSPEGLMSYIFKTQKVPDEAFAYLKGKMPDKFQDFAENLQEKYDKRLEAKQKEFDVLFDQVFSGVSIDQYDPNEIADLKEMIYTSAKNSRSINELNEWYDDDKTRFIKYRKCVDMRVADEKEMWEDIQEIGDFQLGYAHDELRKRYQQERKHWGGGTYYSPGDQWMYVKDMKAKVKARRRQMEQGNDSMQSSLEGKFEGGAFDWGDNEKLGKRMKSYLGGVLEKAPTLVEREQILRSLESRFPTLQSQLQAMHGLWDGMEKEVGKDNIDPKFLSQRDTLWKSMLGQIMPRDASSFAPDRWNISDQLSGLRKLVSDIRTDRVKGMDEETKKKDVEEKIKKGDIAELPVDDERLAKPEKFNEILLKSWGYTKSQFTAAVGGDKAKAALKKLHDQWQQEHEKHWDSVVSEQTSRLNRKVDALPGAYAAVGKFFIDGMKKQAGPDKPTQKRHAWLLKNEPAILDTINAMDRYVREYDVLMTKEFATFVHQEQPQIGQKLNGVWHELTGKVSNGDFAKLGTSLGGYDGKTKTLYQQAQKAYEAHLKEQEELAQTEQEQQEQEAADKKLETAFKTGQSALDTRFSFFMRRHQAVQAQGSGGTAGTTATAFANEAELKKAVLGGMTGMDAYADKEYFDTWVADKFKALQEGEMEEEGDIFATIKALDKKTETTRKTFEDAGYPIDDMRQLELLDKYNIRPDYLGRTGLNIDQLTKGLERVERLSAESGKVGYIDQMLKENSLNSTGVFGTMIVGMLSVMNPNDFDAWKADLRKMEFKMGKPGREDAVLLMNSLFTNNRLMSQVNRDLSDLKSKFCSEGLRLINVDLKEILEDKEAATLAEILEELEKAEQEREPDTPIEEVEGYFNLAGAEVSEREAIMAQLAAYRFDPAVSSKGLSAQYLDQGLERIAILEQVQAFTPLDKVLREGTQNGYLPNHLFESLAIISDAEFKQWETQVRGMNLSGMNDEEKAYAMLQLLFDQGTLDRVTRLEGEETTEQLNDGATEQMEEEEAEQPSDGTTEPLDGMEVDVGHTIDLEGEDPAATAQGDDTTVVVGEEKKEKGERIMEEGEATEQPNDGTIEEEGGATEPLDDRTTEEDAEMTDEAIDAQADEGDELLEMEEVLTDEEIDAQADEGDELLDQELETDEDEEEIPEEELVGVLDDSTVESVEGGEDLGAQSVAESQEIDGLGDDDEELIDGVRGEGGEGLSEEAFDDAMLEEQPYATAEDFSDDEEGEEATEPLNDGMTEVLEDQEEEEMTDEEIDAEADQGEELLEGEETTEPLNDGTTEEEGETTEQPDDGTTEVLEDQDEEEMTDEEIDAEADQGDALLESEEEEQARLEEEQAELEAQEQIEAEEEEQARIEEEEAEAEEQEKLEAEEAEQAELERIEAEEAEEAEKAELEEQAALEAEEEEQAKLKEEEAELEEQEQLEAAEAEAELEESLDKETTIEEQTELVAEIRTWLETDGWQLGVEGLDQAGQKLRRGEVLEEKEQEKLETAFDAAQDASDQQLDVEAEEAEALTLNEQAQKEQEEQELLEAEEAEQEELEAEEILKSEEEEKALAEEQEAERQAEVERMLAEFIELMVGEKEKAEMDRQKEEAEKEERKEQVLELIADSARTERNMEGGGLDLDGVLDVFREDIADFGQNRLVKKIYHSKDVMRKARGMMEYFLSQDMYKQLLQLNMRSTSMLSEEGWHFFAELYGDVYVARVMTMQEILRRFYHYVSLLEEGNIDLQISVSKALLESSIDNAESVYRQLVGFYHMKKKQSGLKAVKFTNEGKILRAEMVFDTGVHVTTITVQL